jgi:hypothetical protein
MAQDCATHSLESTILVMKNELDDNNIEAGRQMIQDIPGDLLRSKRTPEFTEEKTAKILEMQQHENLQDIKLRIKGEIRDPKPQAGAALPEHLKIYYRNLDAFAINSKDILFRRWFQKDGEVKCIPVIDNAAVKQLVITLHRPGVQNKYPRNPHPGNNRTFEILAKQFYAFHLRYEVKKVVKLCASCRLNNHVNQTRLDNPGMILSTETFDTFQVDVIGPLHQCREFPYIFTCVNTNSKYSFAIPIKSTQDQEVCKCLELIRFANNGFPRRIQADSALFTEHALSTKILRTEGVEIAHGLPYISRGQSVIERYNSTLMRSLIKMQTTSSQPLQNLVTPTTMHFYLTPNPTLGNKTPCDMHFRQPRSTFVQLFTEIPEE